MSVCVCVYVHKETNICIYNTYTHKKVVATYTNHSYLRLRMGSPSDRLLFSAGSGLPMLLHFHWLDECAQGSHYEAAPCT